MGYDAVENMTRADREWFLRRLNRQLKQEHEEMKKAANKTKKGKR